ncbi:MAG TPA: OsmC family peroxiredoxin [Bacteroidales bacterium]|nr:OsmC family peroxiredoxin [Bacteroidales bacterium]
MSKSIAKAIWRGTLQGGAGTMSFTDFSGPFTFASRFEDGTETNPEELIGAAHAGCFSMFLSALLSEEGLHPESIETDSTVHLDKDDIGPVISTIELDCEVSCNGLSQEKFEELTKAAKEKCPVSRLVAAADVKLKAKLV